MTYNGQPQKWEHYSVSGDGFVGQEGVTCDFSATVTDVSDGQVTNTFSYTFKDDTQESNYSITKEETGLIAIVPISTQITITAGSDHKVYDGSALSCDTYSYTENVLIEGDVLTATTQGSVTNVSEGEVANNIKSYEVKRGKKDIKSNYTFGQSVDGKLYITPLEIEYE